MPNWLFIAIWALWIFWSIQQLLLWWAVTDHNSNIFRVQLQGRMTFNTWGKIKAYIWVVFSFLWLCYAIFR